jgi:hypothetical protein
MPVLIPSYVAKDFRQCFFDFAVLETYAGSVAKRVFSFSPITLHKWRKKFSCLLAKPR